MGYSAMLEDNDRVKGKDIYALVTSHSYGTIFAYAFVFVVGIYAIFYQSDSYLSIPLFELLWNALVYITPPSLVLAFENPKNGAKDKGVQEGTYAASRTFARKSQAMRRILGIDGAGVLTNVQRARSLSGIGSLFKTLPSNALPGLGNWDNSCYQNSILQGLSSLPSLYSFLLRVQTTVGHGNPLSTNDALRHLIEELNTSKNAGRKLWTPPALKNMSSWQQQDAQEYYSKVVDEMEKEIIKALKSQTDRKGLGIKNIGLGVLNQTSSRKMRQETSNESEDVESAFESSACPQNPLEGLLAQRVGCLQCGFVEGLSMIPFNCLTVPLGRQLSYDIQRCLDDYTSLEPINGVECAKCTLLRSKEQLNKLLTATFEGTAADGSSESKHKLSGAARELVEDRLEAVQTALVTSDFSEATLSKKCKIQTKDRVNTTKSRQAVVARAPQALVIHINRSMFDEYSGMMSKNYASVRFPKILDLSRWCLGGAPEESEAERWTLEPSKSMLVDQSDHSTRTATSTQNLYVLRALVTHYGRHENGHYIAYRQTPHHGDSMKRDNEPTQAQWWRLSDEDVGNVSEDHVLAQEGVFMLFYERNDLDRILPTDPTVNESPDKIAPCSLMPSSPTGSYEELVESKNSQINGERPSIIAKPSILNSAALDLSSAMEDQQPMPIKEAALTGTAFPQSADTDVLVPEGTKSAQVTLEGLSPTDSGTDTLATIQRTTGVAAQGMPKEASQESEKDNKLQFPRMRTSSKRVPVKDEFDQLGGGAGLVQAV